MLDDLRRVGNDLSSATFRNLSLSDIAWVVSSKTLVSTTPLAMSLVVSSGVVGSQIETSVIP
jgi:hypothetical protein